MAFECSCALLPTITGNIARQRMDALADAYNEAILELIREWEEEGDESLGVMFQPGEAIDLDLWPGESLSRLDCFHPSAEAHKRVGAGFWNRLTMSLVSCSLERNGIRLIGVGR
jgi:phospholipase B1